MSAITNISVNNSKNVGNENLICKSVSKKADETEVTESGQEDDNSEENTSEYADVSLVELTESFHYKDSASCPEKDCSRVVYSKSSDNLSQLRPRIGETESKAKGQLEPLDWESHVTRAKPYNNQNYRSSFYFDRNCTSQQDIREFYLDRRSPTTVESDQKQFEREFEVRRKKLQNFLGIESPAFDKCSDRETAKYRYLHFCSEGQKSALEYHKKRVRFSVSRMEGELNFRVTLSIKNEANGQTVFYKVDKNRFRKEKTIKLMVESMYRIDISFKPTQTLARALVRGHEVQTIERVHDSTASAYSLHLPTSNLHPSPKGHRDEITFLIQLANGLVLQTFLQVKFYKAGDTQHCEWGSTFHCVEYECEAYPESGVIAILKETFR